MNREQLVTERRNGTSTANAAITCIDSERCLITCTTESWSHMHGECWAMPAAHMHEPRKCMQEEFGNLIDLAWSWTSVSWCIFLYLPGGA